MTNAINNMGNSTPFDMDSTPEPAQSGMQADAQLTSVRMFSPDNADDAGNAQSSVAGAASHAHAGHAHRSRHAAAGGNGSDAAAQDGGAAAKGGSGNDMSAVVSQIMDIIKTAISAATQLASPLLGLFTSMMGNAGTSGAGTA